MSFSYRRPLCDWVVGLLAGEIYDTCWRGAVRVLSVGLICARAL